jgi:hypothetical protein
MKKAQEEIDRVVGTDRMPEFHDKDQLPYVLAVINETLRFAFHLYLRPYVHSATDWVIGGDRYLYWVEQHMRVQPTTSSRESRFSPSQVSLTHTYCARFIPKGSSVYANM